MVYADEGIKPYLSKQGVMNLRSSFAKDIFAQDLYFVYEKKLNAEASFGSRAGN